jgi:hypothetical protein
LRKQARYCIAILYLLLFFLLLHAVCLSALSLERQRDFQGLDFYFDCLADWDVSGRGTSVSGNLSMEGPCSKISVFWARDPGIDPEIILDSIEDAYEEGDVRVVSAERGKAMLGDINAISLDLDYEFKGCKSKKRFISWNSSASDRLFVATLSTCRWEEDAPLFDRTVASFQDEGQGGQMKLNSNFVNQDPVWSLLLGDLLSSYHYLDSQTLPPRSVKVLVEHVLIPENGSLQMYSSETLSADPPVTAAKRAAVLLQILQQEGYTTRLVQRSGQIRLAVEDPSDTWRAVSLNPADPDMEIGVLLDGASQGIAYDSIKELEEANRIDISPIEEDKLVQKDCDTSSYVELKRPTGIDTEWQQELQDILEGFEYEEKYQENVFDCSNTAQICCELLQSREYDARLMMGWEGHPLGKHLWVVVSYPDEAGTYVAVETANTDGGKRLVNLGKIAEDLGYFEGIMYDSSAQFSRLHAEEGINVKDIHLIA